MIINISMHNECVLQLGVTVHSFKPSTWEAEASGIYELEAILVYTAPGQSGIYSETLS